MIEKTVRRSQVGPGRVRYRVVITGEPCTPKTHESRQHQYLFLHWIADNQHMLECGYNVPDKVSVTHNGTSWQAEAEAEVDEETA
jgi:hypothetical protein